MENPTWPCARDVMDVAAPSLEAHATVEEARTLLAESRSAHLLVTRDGRLAGLLGERELREWASGPLRERDARLHLVMARKPLAVDPHAPLEAVLGLFVDHRLQAIAVVDAAGEPLGVLSLYEVARALRLARQGSGAAAGA